MLRMERSGIWSINIVIIRFFMKINKDIRKKAIKRMIARYEKLQSEVNPYGFNADDGMKYYYLIDYWEDRLNEL